MRRVLIPTALLLACSMVLGATVFREQIAQAARQITPVEVTNTPEQAVPVREQATLQPVQSLVFGSFAAGDRFSTEEVLYTVPAGKTLVIEAFTTSSNMAADDTYRDGRLEVEGGGDSFTWFLQPVNEGVSGGTGARVFRGSTTMRAYAGPGTEVVAEGVREGGSLSSTAVGFEIAGYLVDTP